MQQDVIESAFEQYSTNLEELEKRDIRALNSRLNELRMMQKNLTRDMLEADSIKLSQLKRREQLLVANSNPNALPDNKLRIRCEDQTA